MAPHLLDLARHQPLFAPEPLVAQRTLKEEFVEPAELAGIPRLEMYPT
jgi:hypothetical protein